MAMAGDILMRFGAGARFFFCGQGGGGRHGYLDDDEEVRRAIM